MRSIWPSKVMCCFRRVDGGGGETECEFEWKDVGGSGSF